MAKVKREQILLGISTVLILGMLFKFAYQPQIRKIVALKGELVKISQQLRESRILSQQKTSKNSMTELRQKFATENEINGILSFLAKSAEEAAVTLNSISQREAVKKKFYMEIPVEIELIAGYRGILDCLGKIGKFPKLLRVANIEIMRDETILPKLRVKLLVKIYVLSK